MSILEQLGARLRGTADELPFDAVAVAAERLRVATDLLMWVRRSSTNPLGVPGLANATEHLEQANYALRVGQDTIGDYLAAIGLAYQSTPSPDQPPSDRLADTEQPVPESDEDRAEVSALGRWWEGRVNYLAEHADDPHAGKRTGDEAAHRGRSRDAATSSTELLRETARQVQSGDRERLRTELSQVEAPVGLGLSALTPPVLRRLATELLGHEPGPKDLDRLDAETRDQIRQLLPRLPERVVREQLARVCRSPSAWSARKQPDGSSAGSSDDSSKGSSGGASNGASDEPTHPTDSAVAGAVLTGILLRRLGQNPDSLRPADDEPARQPDRPKPPKRTEPPTRPEQPEPPTRSEQPARPLRQPAPDPSGGRG